MAHDADNEPRAAANWICRCEEIDAATIQQAIAEGARSLNDVKRRTRAGMGLCQGIFCLPLIAEQIHVLTDQPPAAIGPMTARPPTRPLTLARLAESEADVAGSGIRR